MHLLRKCPCPVWMERESAAAEADADQLQAPRLLAAVDAAQRDSQALNQRILDTAAALAAAEGAALDLVHAWQDPFDGTLPTTREGHPTAEPGRLADAVGVIEQAHGAALNELAADYRAHMNGGDAHLLRGVPAEQILQLADTLGSDLIVLATLSRPREPGLFIGGTAEDLLANATTSVLALKPDGFVSPVR